MSRLSWLPRASNCFGACGLLVVGTLVLCGCGSNGSAHALTITSFGPQDIKAGVAFNIQPDGQSSVWIKVDRPLQNDAVIFVNGIKLNSAASGSLVTAEVPADVYAHAGTYPMYVVEHDGGTEVKSDEASLIVSTK